MRHSDFIVYVDESGDHSLEFINPRYPLFVLAMCVMRKTSYTHHITPAVRALKFATFGHDMAILHESDIRKRTGAFTGWSRERCDHFLDRLTDLIDEAKIQIVAVAIDKRRLCLKSAPIPHVYHLALAAALESLFRVLRESDQDGCVVHIVCEARGRKEDAELAKEFKRLCDEAGYEQRGICFELVIADKKTNSEGLQLADLMARPIGLSVLRPNQFNRAVDVILQKLTLVTMGRPASGLVVIF
jgi:hypothetical protein